jgi:2,3-diketo-5-methylthio-1-phosphopentane phosphatase
VTLPRKGLPAADTSTIVFVDFDGTITDVDTFDALVRDAVGDDVWDAIDAELMAGHRTLREVLALQASHISKSKAEALAFVEATATVDPAFGPFVHSASERGADVCVVSSGVAPIIRTALARAGVDVPVLANEVDFGPTGWTIDFIDDSANGHDKAAAVRRARDAGRTTVFVGDGVSDFDAAHEAGRCFAKAGRALEAYCRERGIACTSFRSFAEIESALFARHGGPTGVQRGRR